MAATEKQVRRAHQETLDLPVHRESGETEASLAPGDFLERSDLKVHPERRATTETPDSQGLEAFQDPRDLPETPYGGRRVDVVGLKWWISVGKPRNSGSARLLRSTWRERREGRFWR